MLNQPIQEGPPNRTQMIADALAEIDEQYSGIHDVLGKMVELMESMDKRIEAIEKHMKRR